MPLVINDRFQCEPTKCLEYSRDMTKTAESGELVKMEARKDHSIKSLLRKKIVKFEIILKTKIW